MTRTVVLLMPWGRVGSNLVNSVITRSKALRVWNEPLTGVQTRVIGAGGTVADVWPAQREWLVENILPQAESVFLNVAANSVGDPHDFATLMEPVQPVYLVLDRLDDLATAISALRTEAWVREGVEKGEKRSWSIPSGESVNFRPQIDPAKLKAAYTIIQSGRRNIETITSGRPRSDFLYEDLLRDMKTTVEAILDAAGVPVYAFKVTSAKFGSDALADMVENANDLAQVARDLSIRTELRI